ncbi:hypothetical protein CDCE8392_2150 [Corynebacterium diphtheriae CDCE 8392]|nr:hypothetical protein CDCE8392_2150 [Corynebacterium diphtheriae CDCE 8392]AEX84329.1 hypothetical protein CDVA01_2065 [Corynebacterium diphtheriae VA01]
MKNPSKYPRLVAFPVVECIDCVSDVGEDVFAAPVHGSA